MIVPKIRHITSIVSFCVFVAFGLWLFWWTTHNPLPDGYQNEYLHVGNAYDLYEAVITLDWWHIRWYAYTSYWPWGFYAVPLLGLLPFGKGIEVLILSNLLYLLALIWAMQRLGTAFQRPAALGLLLLSPAVFGAMTRFEPNFANVALMAVGLLCLIESKDFQHRGWTIGWGVALGIGLMLDRLTLLFFLLPPVIPIVWKYRSLRLVRRNTLWGFGVAFILTIAYYREFFLRHSQELISQAPVGEIDAAGTLVESVNPVPWLYYLLSLFDNQQGYVIALLSLVGLVMSLRTRGPKEQILLWSILPGVTFFTFIAKKQVYYTFPILVPLSLMAARFGRWSWLGVVGGFVLWLQQGWGILPTSVPLNPPMPDRIVEPRYLLARPPTMHSYSIEQMMSHIDGQPKEVIVFSEDQGWYEGFVVLQFREYLNGHIRGVTADPTGIWEFKDQAEYLIWVRPTASTDVFPQGGRITAELLSDHYTLDELPDLSTAIPTMSTEFTLLDTWQSQEDSQISIFARISQQ